MYNSNHVLGIVGGRDAALAARFFELLTARTPAQRDQEHLHVLISAGQNTIAGHAEGTVAIDLAEAAPPLSESARALQAAGASLLVLPGEARTRLLEELEQEMALPVLRWIDVTVGAAREVAGPTALVMHSEACTRLAYQRGFEHSGGSYVIPPSPLQHDIDAAAVVSPDDQRQLAASVVDHMAALGATSVLIASEALMSAIGPARDHLRLPILDPAAAVTDYVLRLTRPDAPVATAAALSAS